MSESTWIPFRLVPDDVLFFRDGKPSSRGDDHYLRSLFPPYPSTLYGALRTRRLLDHDIALQGLSQDTLEEPAWRPHRRAGQLGRARLFGAARPLVRPRR